ncbi:MAG: nucleotide sugar dehydrogenase [Marmoricola sp.]|nr:nucleotide sugar dehydrogenase [Marmoricola sp.]
MNPPSPRLVVVGQGYVGLPIAMRAVEVGYDVVGLDIDTERVDQLRSGRSYVEDVSGDIVRAAVESGRFRPTVSIDDAAGFDYAIITVPTPLRDTLPDLSFIEDASRGLALHLKVGATVVLESTTYPGTTEELMVPLLEAGSGLSAGTDFFVGYSPERIDPGNPVYNFVNTPKVVSGLGAEGMKRVIDLYASLVETVVPVSTPKEAELTKLLENTFRHVNIALVNELAVFAKDLGIDVWEAIDAASTKPFGYMRFTPGPGVGGHCLPVDPSYLSWQVRKTLGHSFRFVELANDVNDHMPDYVVRRLILALNATQRSVSGSNILVLGLAYKKNTGDARESPSLRILELLHALGAHLTVCDTHVADRQVPGFVERRALSREVLDACDVAVLVTDHDDFDYDLLENSTTYVLDTRRRVRGKHVEHL